MPVISKLWIATVTLLLLAAQAPDASARKKPRLRKVGYSVKLGGNTFRIWGGAKTGIMPKGCSVSPDGKHLYVTNFGRRRHHNLNVIDALTMKPIKEMHWKGNSIESESSLDSKTLFVTDWYGSRLHFVDTATWKITKSVHLGNKPKWMALSPKGKYLYVANWGGKVVKLDAKTGQKLASVKTGRYPRGISVTPDGKTLYVANVGSRYVSVVDAAAMKVTKQIRTRKHPRHTALTKDGKLLYVSILSDGTIAVIDTKLGKVKKRVFVGSMPRTIALSADERFVYVAVYARHRMAILDTKTFKVAQLDLDIIKASGLAVHPKDRFIYVTGWCSADVWAIERIKPGEKAGPLGKPPKRRLYYNRKKVNPFSLGCR